MGRFIIAAIAASFVFIQIPVNAQSESAPDRQQQRNALRAEFFGETGQAGLLGQRDRIGHGRAYSSALLELDQQFLEPLTQNADLLRQGRCISRECPEAFSANEEQGEVLRPVQNLRAKVLESDSALNAIVVRWAPPEWTGRRDAASEALRYEIAVVAGSQYSVYSVSEKRQIPLDAPRRGAAWVSEDGRMAVDTVHQQPRKARHRIRRSAYIDGIPNEDLLILGRAVYEDARPESEKSTSGDTRESGDWEQATVDLSSGDDIAFGTIGEVPFDDPDLRACIVDSYPRGEATPLKDIESVDCPSRNISSIGGIEHLKWVTSVNLFDNPFSGVGPLSGLIGLQSLNISNTSVRRLYALGSLPGLKYLYMSQTPATGIAPLGGLASLQELEIQGSEVLEIPDLSSTNLAYLDASNTELLDISGLEDVDSLEVVTLRVDGSEGDESRILRFGDVSAIIHNASSPDSSLARVDLTGNTQVYCFHVNELETAIQDIGGVLIQPDLCSDIPVPTSIGGAPRVSQFNNYVVAWSAEGQLAGSFFRLEEWLPEMDHYAVYTSSDTQFDMSDNDEQRVGIYQYRVQHCYENDSNCSGWSVPYDQVILASPDVPGEEVLAAIPDPAFRSCMVDHLEYETETGEPGYLTNGEVDTLKCWSRGITDINGIELLPSLTGIQLNDNEISELAPLELLLDAANFGIEPSSVGLGRNQIASSELHHLVSAGASIKQLNLASNQISDIDELADAQPLVQLDLSGNTVSDLSPLSSVHVLTLKVERNGLTAIPDLNGTGRIAAAGNSIHDLSGLASISDGLIDLDFSDNPITSAEISMHLSNAPNLRFITLDRTSIDSMEFAASYSGLTRISINETPVGDLTGLEGLDELLEIGARSTLIDTLDPLAGLELLRTLSISGGDLSSQDSLEPLISINTLGSLMLSDNGVTRIQPLLDLIESPDSNLNPANNSSAVVDLSGERNIQCGEVHQVYQAGVLSVNEVMEPECVPDADLESSAWLDIDGSTFDLNWELSRVPPGYLGTSGYEIQYAAADGSPASTVSINGATRSWAELELPNGLDEAYEFRVRACRLDGICGEYPDSATSPYYPLTAIDQVDAELQPDDSVLLSAAYNHSTTTPQAQLEMEVSALFADAPFNSVPYAGGDLELTIPDISDFPGGIIRVRICRTISGERQCGPSREIRAIEPPIDPMIPAPTGLMLGDDGGRLRLDHGEHYLSWNPVEDDRVDYYRVERNVAVGNESAEEMTYNIEAPMMDIKRFDGDPNEMTSYRVKACEKVEGGVDLCSDFSETQAMRIDGVDSVELSKPIYICWFWSEDDDPEADEFSLRWTYPIDASDAPRQFRKGGQMIPYNDSAGLMSNVDDQPVEFWEITEVKHDRRVNGNLRYADVYATFRSKSVSRELLVHTEDAPDTVWNYSTKCDDSDLVDDENGTNVVGPQSLNPGHYTTFAENDTDPVPGNSTGWSFYWTKEPRTEGVNDSFGRAHDLLAFWYTYRKFEGESELTPVWYYARLYQTDPQDENFVAGALMYPQAGTDGNGNGRNDIGVGRIRINFDDNHQQAQIELDIRQDSHLTSFSLGDTNDSVQTFSIRDFSTDRDVFEANDFGLPNRTDHYSGIWTPEPDTVFTELDQILEQNEVFLSEWIVGNLSSIGVKSFDQAGEPIWFIEFKCQYSDAQDPCYADEDDDENDYIEIDFSASRLMDGFHTVFPGPGTGPLDPVTPPETVTAHSIPASGSGLRRRYNDPHSGQVHTQQREGKVCIDLFGTLPALGSNDARPYAITLGGGGSGCSSAGTDDLAITKIANLHYIDFVLDGDRDKHVCTPQDVSEGGCTAELTWFTDGYYPDARPMVMAGDSEPAPLEQVCRNQIDVQGLNPYQDSVLCELDTPGTYRFHLSNRLTSSGGYQEKSANIATTRALVVEQDLDATPVSPPQVPFTPAPVSETDLVQTSRVGVSAGDFAVNESGAATYTIPVMTAPAPGDVAPVISIDYNSAAGSGQLGPGWNISGLSAITRCRQTVESGDDRMGIVDFSDSDRFCLDGVRLKLIGGEQYGEPDSEYRLEIDDFTRIKAVGQVAGEPAYFEAHGKDGSVRIFGSPHAQDSARIAAGDSGEIVAWPVSEFRDSADNYYIYSYFRTDFSGTDFPEDTVEWGIESISYTGNSKAGTSPFASIEFLHEEIPEDQQSVRYMAGIPLADTKVVDRVQSVLDDGRALRDYRLFYADTGNAQNQFVLQSVQECWDAAAEKDDDSSCFRPTGFEWVHDNRKIFDTPSYEAPTVDLKAIRSGEMNGDGKTDFVTYERLDDFEIDRIYVWLSSDSGGFYFSSVLAYPCFFDSEGAERFALADPFGEGRGALFFVADCNGGLKLWMQRLTSENELSAPESVLDLDGAIGLSEAATLSFVDWSGDGVGDVVLLEPLGSRFWFAENTSEDSLSGSFGELIEVNADEMDPWWEDKCALPTDFLSASHSVRMLTSAAFSFDGGSKASFLLEHTVDVQCRGENPPNNEQDWSFPVYPIVSVFKDGEGGLDIVLEDKGPGTSHAIAGDINGDGLTDIVYFDWLNSGDEVSGVTVGINKGDAIETQGSPGWGDEFELDVEVLASARLIDFDGDGFLDLLVPSEIADSDAYWEVYPWQVDGGVGRFAASPLEGPEVGNLGSEEPDYALFADFSGDSRLDYLSARREGGGNSDSLRMHLSSPGNGSGAKSPPGKIIAIENGFGASTQIHYKPLTDESVYGKEMTTSSTTYGRGSKVYDTQQPYYVVSSVVSDVPQHEIDPESGELNYISASDGTATVQYHYAGAKFQAGGRGFLGFREVTTFDAQSGVLSTTRYSQRFPYIGRPESTRTWHLQASPWQTGAALPNFPSWPDMQACDDGTQVRESGALLTGCSENQWSFVPGSDNGIPDSQEEWDDEPVVSIYLANSEEWNIEVSFTGASAVGKLTHRVVTARSEIDPFGNAGIVEAHTYKAASSIPFESKIVESIYENHVDDWHLGRMICSRVETVRAEVPGNLDLPPSAVRVTGFSYDPDSRLLNKEVVEPDDCNCRVGDGATPDTDQCAEDGLLVTRHTHDDFGNRLRTESIARSEASGITEQRRLQGREYGNYGSLVLTEYEGIDYAGGQWQTAEIASSSEHDQFGNSRWVQRAGGPKIERSYDYMGRPLEERHHTGQFKRTLREARDNHGSPPDGCPGGTAFMERTVDGTGSVSEVCKDILGREVRSRTMGFADLEVDDQQLATPWVHVDTHYDYASRVVEKSAPYFAALAGDNPEAADNHVFWTRKLHDELGRIIEVVRPLGSGDYATESVVYRVEDGDEDGFENDVLITETINDWGQRNVEARSILGDKIWERSPSEARTDFDYDHLGNLVRTNGPLSGAIDQIEVEYDELGNKEKVSDPDKGVWHYEYDALGILHYQIDAKGQATVFEYDDAGRKISRKEYAPESASTICEPDAPGVPAGCILRKETYWVYGQVGQPEYGLVTYTSTSDYSPDGSETFETFEQFDYDWAGRVYQKVTRFAGTALPNSAAPEYVERWTYDEFGREFQHFDAGSDFVLGPDDCHVGDADLNLDEGCLYGGEGTLKVYNGNGHLVLVKEARYGETNSEQFDAATYWAVQQKDARGNVVEAVMGNQQRILADYNPATGWLENRVDGLGQQTAQAIAYHWDSIGRLQTRSDLVSISQSEVFSYDDDNRLTKVQYSSTGDIDDLVTRQRIEYDASGNIKCKSDTYGASASACTWGDDSGDYLYDQYNQPHAVIEAGNREFEYDANGNVIRDFTGGASEPDLREYEYSVADRLQRVVRDGTETRFYYGASREKRIKRIDSPDGVYWTFYVGSTEITHSESELNVSDYEHVTSGRVQRHVAGILIVDKEFRSSIYAFSYLHKNHQGSIVAISDGLGDVVDHMRYDAWGARRDVDKIHLQPPVWSAGLDPFVAQFTAYTHKGYTGHEHVDQAGIIHMEGRIYDPILGRFLQADPLIEDVGTLNRYTYVHNNPLAFVDPNGFFSIGNLLTGALAIAISVVTGFAAAGIWATNMAASITVAAVGGAAAGFVVTGTGEGALLGAFTAVAALGVTQYLSSQEWAFQSGSFTTEGNIARSVGVGLSSGISSDLQGGKFGHGFFTAGVSSLVSPAISDISDSDYLNAFGASLVGGTLSKATGGKFANGAATGAMAYALSSQVGNSMARSGEADSGESNPELVRDIDSGKLVEEVYADFPSLPEANIHFVEEFSEVPWYTRFPGCSSSAVGCFTGDNTIYVEYGGHGRDFVKTTIAHELLHVDEANHVIMGDRGAYRIYTLIRYRGHNPVFHEFDVRYLDYLNSTPRMRYPKPNLDDLPWRQ